MVVPIRDLGNKFFSALTTHSKTSNMTLSDDVDMAVDIGNTLFNNYCDEVRGQSMSSDKQGTRTPSMSSSKCNEEYMTRVQRESDRIVEDNYVIALDSPQLEYTISKTQSNCVSKATDYTTNMRQQCAKHEIPALNNNINNADSSNSNVINIQLNYNINQALDQDSWDRDFRAMKHLASDIRNIKKSLVRMKKYIYSKSIEGNKVNNIEDLKSIGKMAWKFISSLYEAH